MDTLNYFKQRLGLNTGQTERFGILSPEERIKQLEEEGRRRGEEIRRKREEEERRKKEEERKKQEAKAKMEALKAITASQQIEGIDIDQISKDPSQPPIRQDRRMAFTPSDFNRQFTLELNRSVDAMKSAGMKEDEIKNALTPKDDVTKRLSELKEMIEGMGDIGPIDKVRLGWYNRELMDMLSKETVKQINGQPNRAKEIEEFIEKHPELIETVEDNPLLKLIEKGLKGVGSQTKLLVESTKAAATDPTTYIIAGTILAASLMAAPVTGGASLTAIPLAATPFLGTGMAQTITTAVASLSPSFAIKFGMTAGQYKYMAKLEEESSYIDLVNNGVDKRIAGDIAATVGAVNGLIESLQIDQAFSMIPGVDDLVSGAKNMAKKELVNRLIKTFANYGVNVTSEAIEEALQAGVTELGTSLGVYLQNAPDPSTIGGLKQLAKTMGEKDYWNLVLSEGYEALQTMWLTPIVSSGTQVAVRQIGNTAQNKLIENKVQQLADMEESQRQQVLKDRIEYVTDGITDQLITQYNETRDPEVLGYLLAEEQVIKDMMKMENVSNQDKAKLQKQLEKIQPIISKALYDAQLENLYIEYKPTNEIDIENELLQEGFLDENETFNDDTNEYTIELYKQAKEYGVVDKVVEELNKGTNKAEIMEMISNQLPRKVRKNQIEVMALINAVETIQSEIKGQVVINTIHNLQLIREMTDELAPEVEIPTEIKRTEETDAPEGSTTAKEEATQPEGPVAEETAPETPTDAPMEIKNDMIGQRIQTTKYGQVEIVDINNNLVTVKNELGTEFQVGKKALEEMIETTIETVEDTTIETVEDTTIETAEDTIIETVEDTTYNPSDVVKIPVSQIRIDPERFQFRYEGTTKKLEGAEYDPMLAGVVLLWQDENGDLYVVNGHHRVDLAKANNIQEMDARIITHKDATAEEARAMGAMINIAEGSATAIDVAKVLKEHTITEEELQRYISPRSKIARDGIALSKLNDWIFTQVATRRLPLERSVIIGQELGDNSDAQNQVVKALGELEAKGKTITNDVLRELILEAKGTLRETYTEVTLFGEEMFTRDYALERAELIAYVKRQLRERKNILKNVTKEKNAAMLEELGNVISIDENVKEMNAAEQALWIIDKTVNYQGTRTNELFNNLAKEYGDADPKDRNAIKKKALNELLRLVESGELFNETVRQKIERESLKASLHDTRTDGEGEQGLTLREQQEQEERQITLFGEETIMQLKQQPQVRVVADENAQKSSSYQATKNIAKALQNNVLFNGLTIQYSNKSGKVNMTREELNRNGYTHLEEGEKYIYGTYDPRTRTITLNSEATRDTILEEAIHDLQARLEQIDPDLAVLVDEWENEVREKAAKEGIVIPEGYELLAQALVYTEFGYASTNPYIANLIAVDQEIVDKFRAMLGEEVEREGFGFIDPEVEKAERLLRGEYEKYAERLFKQKNFVKKLKDAEVKRKVGIKGELEKARAATYYHPSNGQYVIVHPSTKGHKYQVTFFSPKYGAIGDAQYDSLDEVADRLIEDRYYFKSDEIHYQLKNQYNRRIADELHKRLLSSRSGEDTDTSRRTFLPIDGWGVREIKEAIQEGNFNRHDYEVLIRGNETLSYDARRILGEMVEDADKKGLHKPNKEVTLKEFLYRFYGVEIENDHKITDSEIRNHFLYRLDIAKERELPKARKDVQKLLEQTGESWDQSAEELADVQADVQSYENIRLRLQGQHKYFQESIETYRNRGLQYQIKPMDEKIDSKEFKEWFGNSKVVDEEGRPLVMYHGTANKVFDEFDINKTNQFSLYGRGFYFTDNKEIATEYQEKDKSYGGIKDIVPKDTKWNEENSKILLDTIKKEIARIENEYPIIPGSITNISFAQVPKEERQDIKNYYKALLMLERDGFYRGVVSTSDLITWMNNTFTRDSLSYAAEKEGLTINFIRDNPGVFETYLSIQNPFNIDEHEMTDREIGYIFGSENIEYVAQVHNRSFDRMMDFLQNTSRFDKVNEIRSTLREKLIRLGYDGITHIGGGRVGDTEHRVYIAFYPTQIKSIDNIGTFDAYNPNIYYQLKDDKTPVTLSNIKMFERATDTLRDIVTITNNAKEFVFRENEANIGKAKTIDVYDNTSNKILLLKELQTKKADQSILDRMLWYAVENGYDYLALPKGDWKAINNQIETIDIKIDDDTFTQRQAIPITQEMAEEVMSRGEPLFRLKPNSSLSEYESTKVNLNTLRLAIKAGGFTQNSLNVEGEGGAGDTKLFFRTNFHKEYTDKIPISELKAVILPEYADSQMVATLKDAGVFVELYKEGDDINEVEKTLIREDTKIKGAWEAETPEEYYQIKEETKELDPDDPDVKERSWHQTVRDANITSPELRSILEDTHFLYEVKHNEDTILAAARLIDEKGEEWVEARILSDLDNDAVLFAASQILTYKYMQSGDTQRAIRLIEKTGEKATAAGQAIQILSWWGRQTPNGMVRYVANQFRNLMSEKDKRNVTGKTNELIAEFNRINEQALEEIDMVGELRKVKEMTPQEKLARRIASHLAEPKERTAMQDMINTLYKIAQESPLPERKTIPHDPLQLVADAIVNREEYRDVWNEAKKIIQEKYADDPAILELLKPYFDENIVKTFAESQLSKALDNELRDMGIEIKDIVRKHYEGTIELTKTLTDKLIEKSGLEGIEAEILATFIKKEMEKKTNKAKESVINNIFKEKKSYERKSLDQQILELSNLGALTNDDVRPLVAEKLGLPVFSKELAEYVYNQAQYIQTLELGSRERDVATAKMLQTIADHMPTSFWQKVATIQTMSHLLNMRTFLRNLIGNTLFGTLDTIAHNYLAAPIDKILSIKTGRRAAIHRNIFKIMEKQWQGYKQGMKLGIEDAILGIDTFGEATKFELRSQRTFKGGILGSLETVLDISLRATDRAAFTAAFFDSLDEQMKIAGVDVPTEEMIDNATALGLYRTFNDATKLSEGAASIKKALNKISGYVTQTEDFGLGDLVLKYPRTPANIIARAIDYSPIGIAISMLQIMTDKDASGYLKQKIAAESLARGLAGTSLIAAGMVLAKLGIITGNKDDDDKDIYELRKQYGLSDYSVNMSALKRYIRSGFKDPTAGELRFGDEITSYDWAEPLAIHFAVGADTQLGSGEALSTLGTIISALEAGGQALTGQPLLLGLTKLFQYGDLVEGLTNVLAELPASFTPALLSQIAYTLDPVRRDPYTLYTREERMLNAVMNKIPGLKEKLPARYTVLGDIQRYADERDSLIERAFRSMISPANINEYKPTPEVRLIIDLYERTGLTDHIPRKIQRSYTFDGVEYELTPEEYAELSEWAGKEIKGRINYAMDLYMADWSDEDKVEEIAYIIKEVSKEVREKVREMKNVPEYPEDEEDDY